MEKNKQVKLNLDGIIKVLESHNITTDDLKKLNELQKLKQNNIDILKLLDKLENAFKSKKISFESAMDSQKRILEILKDIVPAPVKKVKKNKDDNVVSDNKEDLEKNTNL
jgi:hypothetical protein